MKDEIRLIRKELLIKDEPMKAYNMLLRFRDEHGIDLKEEIMKTKTMINHAFDPEDYRFTYNENMQLDNYEDIEPIEVATKPWLKYYRYAWVLDNLKQENAQSYMDMGCYVGSMVTAAAHHLDIPSYGVDFTMKAIVIARRRAKDLGLEDKCRFWAEDVTKFNKQKAEHVSSMEVLEHVVDHEAYLKHLADLATKWVYISTPSGPYGNGEGNLPGWDLRGPTDRRGHLRVFTKDTLKKLLEKLGMEIDNLVDGEDGLLHVKYRRAQ